MHINNVYEFYVYPYPLINRIIKQNLLLAIVPTVHDSRELRGRRDITHAQSFDFHDNRVESTPCVLSSCRRNVVKESVTCSAGWTVLHT